MIINNPPTDSLSQILAESVQEVPRQLPVIAQASLDLAGALRPTHVAIGEHIALLLKQRSGGIWESLVPGGAVCALPCDDVVAQRELVELLALAAQAVGASAVYFPMVYNVSRAQRWLSTMPSVRSWERPGSPSVAVDEFETAGSVFAAASIRPRLARRWAQRLQREQLNSSDALDTLRQIESHSWKKSMGCSIFDGEEDFFDTALRTRTYTAWIARHEGEPIAYRIDAGVGPTMYTMELSYDQRFGNLSPGVFLALSSVYQARTAGYHQVDLYGSPDRLKCSIETHRRQRTDHLWVRQCWLPEHEELRTERLQHDQGLDNALKTGVGIARYWSTGGGGNNRDGYEDQQVGQLP